MLHVNERPVRIERFQSAPGTSAGRCLTLAGLNSGIVKFQSAPGTSAGRCTARMFTSARAIRFNPRPARVPGDARTHQSWMPGCWCFNPRPARVPGDALDRILFELDLAVSIRARHECRAMRIQARMTGRRYRFQSAPGTSAGRCPSDLPSPNGVHGFNPRPARVPGDASVHRRRSTR